MADASWPCQLMQRLAARQPPSLRRFVLWSPPMRVIPPAGSLFALAAVVLSARGAWAGGVEVAPFAGVQYSGSLDSPSYGRSFSIGSGLDYGGTVDESVSPTWSIELLYSRQPTELSDGGMTPRFDLVVERYMAGIQERTGAGSTRFFGVFLLGLTRFAPGAGSYDAEERFTVGLGLGLKTYLSWRFGLRLETRGFFVPARSGGGVLCSNGSCIFRYRASGLWQGDVSVGAVVAF